MYEIKSGDAVRYYTRDSIARGQVTRHNKEIMLKALSNALTDRDSPWASCSWIEFELIVADNNGFGSYHKF